MSEFKAGAAGESEAQWRQFLAYLFRQSSTGQATTGVVAGLGVAQTTTASASVVVGSGLAVYQSSLTAGLDPLICNADKTIDVLTASPMGALPRYDLVIFNDATAAVEVVIGTPDASPTDPTPSANHVKLARIRNAANATSIPTSALDDLRVFTSIAEQLAQPIGSYGRGVGGTIGNGMAWAKLAFTTTLEEAGGMAQSGGDVTVPRDGEYAIEAQVTFPGAAGLSQIGALISINGGTFVYSYNPASTSGNWSVRTGRPRRLSAGDKVSLSAAHNATGSLATVSDSVATFLTVRRVGA